MRCHTPWLLLVGVAHEGHDLPAKIIVWVRKRIIAATRRAPDCIRESGEII